MKRYTLLSAAFLAVSLAGGCSIYVDDFFQDSVRVSRISLYPVPSGDEWWYAWEDDFSPPDVYCILVDENDRVILRGETIFDYYYDDYPLVWSQGQNQVVIDPDLFYVIEFYDRDLEFDEYLTRTPHFSFGDYPYRNSLNLSTEMGSQVTISFVWE